MQKTMLVLTLSVISMFLARNAHAQLNANDMGAARTIAAAAQQAGRDGSMKLIRVSGEGETKMIRPTAVEANAGAMPAVSARYKQIQDVIKTHIDGENEKDMAKVLSTYADEDPLYQDIPEGKEYRGKSAIAAHYQEKDDAFEELTRPIHVMMIDERQGQAFVSLTIKGVQTGTFRGLAAPADRHEQSLAAWAVFDVNEKGLITRETVLYDGIAGAVEQDILPDLRSPSAIDKFWLALRNPSLLLRMFKAQFGNHKQQISSMKDMPYP